MAAPLEFGTFEDSRDGHVYKTVKFAGKEWFVENLAYKVKGSYAYGNDESNVEKYGRLYRYDSLKDAIPIGWHLPTKTEIDELASALVEAGFKQLHGRVLKSVEWPAERKIEGGTDAVGFNIKAGGYGQTESDFSYLGESAAFWIENDQEKDKASWYWSFDCYAEFNIYRDSGWMCEEHSRSVRLVKNTEKQTAQQLKRLGKIAATDDRVKWLAKRHKSDLAAWKKNPVPEYGSFVDERDGRTYKTVKIGGLEWMAENLDFNAPKSKPDELGRGRLYDWRCMTGLPLKSRFGDFSEEARQAIDGEQFQGIAPEGWHLPSKAEAEHLLKCIAAAGYKNREGFALKAKDIWEKVCSQKTSLERLTCPVCGGKRLVAGKDHDVACPECKGSGTVFGEVPIKFLPGGDALGFGLTPISGYMEPISAIGIAGDGSVVLYVSCNSDEAKVATFFDYKDFRFVRCVRNLEIH
jgi:uncharacterized protein (TIGR02145 family)